MTVNNVISKVSRYWQDLAERAGRTFLQGYFSCWLISGADYESLFTEQNLKLGVTASALSVAMSLGLKKVGNTNSASSILSVGNDPKPKTKK